MCGLRGTWYMFGCTRLEFSWFLHHFMAVFESFKNVLRVLKMKKNKKNENDVYTYIHTRQLIGQHFQVGWSDCLMFHWRTSCHLHWAQCLFYIFFRPFFALFINEKSCTGGINKEYEIYEKGSRMSVKQKSLICHVDCFTNRNIIKTQHFHIFISFEFFHNFNVCVCFLSILLLLLLISISFLCWMLLMNINRRIRALYFNLFNWQFNRLYKKKVKLQIKSLHGGWVQRCRC